MKKLKRQKNKAYREYQKIKLEKNPNATQTVPKMPFKRLHNSLIFKGFYSKFEIDDENDRPSLREYARQWCDAANAWSVQQIHSISATVKQFRPLTWLMIMLGGSGMGAATAAITLSDTDPPPNIAPFTETLPLPPLEFPPKTLATFWRSDTVKSGDTLRKFLTRLDIAPTEIDHFLNTSAHTAHQLQLGIGANIDVFTNDDGELLALKFLRDEEGETILVIIKKSSEGDWHTQRATPHIQTTDTLKSVRIQANGHIDDALIQSDLPEEIRSQLHEIFADRLPLNRLKKGDALDVIYESFSHQGHFMGVGRVLAAEVRSGIHMTQAFYHQHDSESGGYYDFAGNPLKRGFENTVLDNARITSGFGLRVHPILGDVRMHHGVDYAAPIGTPIKSPASGVVSLMGRQGGYGVLMILDHDNGYQTVYAHLSSFAPHLKIGSRVSAGEFIARTGNTGRSTGPHLHFEVRLNKKAVDPSFAVIANQRLEGRDLQRFARNSQDLNRKLGLLSALSINMAMRD